MFRERRVVDNRVFLLGLDTLYRDAMKRHERGELLTCARRVAEAVRLAPADVPVEGYYAEDARLTEYFRLIRALRQLREDTAPAVVSLPELQRLRDVTSSPMYGQPIYDGGTLLPAGRDPLSQALLATFPDWTVSRLTAEAHSTALETDDISLVGLAARAADAVVLAATRESVVLYAMPVPGAARFRPPVKYIWNVDDDLADHARGFVDTYNGLFGEELPAPVAANARQYWSACEIDKIRGRCVRLGFDDSTSPIRHYHWAIRPTVRGDLEVEEFWDDEIWTTGRYRSTH